MRRVPVVPTLLVGLAVAAMIWLGWWQLTVRLPQKEAFLARLAANPSQPPVAFPATPDDTLLFRRTTGTCLPPVAIHLAGAGGSGFRAIAECGPAAGAGLAVQLGTTRDPNATVNWAGGTVRGYIAHAPDSRPVLATLFDRTAGRPMLVADTPPPGLAPGLARNAPPDLSAVPNNHLAYAVQWFFFAAIASVIYALALRWRTRPSPPRA